MRNREVGGRERERARESEHTQSREAGEQAGASLGKRQQ